GAEKSEHGVPIVRRTIAQPQIHLRSGVGTTVDGGCATQITGRPLKEIAKCLIEAAHTAESGSERDVRHRHRGFVDQLFREENAAGLCHGDWRSAKVLKKEPAKLALTQTESLCEFLDTGSVAVERSCVDERERSR